MSQQTTAGVAEAIEQLSPARREELLRTLLRARAGAAQERIPRRAGGGPAPLSFAQQRLWVVHRLEPESAAYNVAHALRLRGPLDPGALRRSLDALVRRHESLRTVFREEGGEPVQVVLPAAPVALPLADLRALAPEEREREARRRAAAEALAPFDLARGPLLRGTLLRLGEADHVLSFTLHHIVSDGWSLGVLVREVSALYEGYARGEEPALAELPVQYADFAVWQRGRLRGGVLEEQLAYWTDRLVGAPPLLGLPTDRPRAAGQGARAGSHRFALSGRASRGVRELSRREGTTPFMTLLAAWQALLGRYAGEEDVVVGSPVAGRTRAELEGVIGFFVNMLPLRADLGGSPTFAELLARVKESALGAYAHQELPFERLVEELVTERSLTHAPLFQVVFSLGAADGADELRLGEAELAPFATGEETAKFDLNLSMVDDGEAFTGVLSYRAALFEPETAARMAAHLETLIEGVAADPGRRLAEIPLLRPAERERLLHGWNAADTGYAGDRCVHELVHAQVLRTPDAPALRFEGEELSYAQLFARACRLAHLLRRHGVGPEARVGICMEPAVEMVVSVLGVLLAGGAYLPLDPELPPERRAFLLHDARPLLVLTQEALAPRLEGCGVPVLCVDRENERIGRESDRVPESGVHPRNLAYVIYTSGSTGRPKGVLVEHASIGNTLLELGRVYGSGPGDRNLLFAPLHFDSSVGDIFVALTSGATLVAAPREAVLPGEGLLALLRDEAVTHMKTTSSALAALPWGELPALRTIVTGGEVCTAELIRRWGQERSFFNGYGATEASMRTTSTRYADPDRDPPIGHPAPNTRLYVLDAALEPAPVGVAGEIYIGGAGVTRGYLNRPALTAERFVPDPHQGAAGARLYRTGDLGRRRADGEVEFLGRVDFQVKVRGFRVELGEIEAALREHPAVAEAVVLLREDVPGDPRLAAYVVAAPGLETAPARLRAHLREKLPEYMVPAAVVMLDAIPLNRNGKADRRALPAPETAAADEVEPPRTEVEEILCGIWAEVLGVERVGVRESFFELGGHSLLATRIVSQARRALSVELPLRALFEAPTVAGLAERVEALRRAALSASLPPVVPAPREGPLPASFAQQRLWVVHRMEPASPAYNMPYRLRLRGALEVDALRRGLDEVARRHESLRTVFREEDGGPVQVVLPPAPVPLPVADLSALPPAKREREARRLAEADAVRPFDLARGPLLRVTLLRLGADDHVLCLTLHHVASDEWSRRVLAAEVSALYDAFRRGEAAPLPDLPVQYADFAVWQRGWLRGEALEERMGYWRGALAGAPPLLAVPTDRPRAAGEGARGATCPFTLSAEASRGVRALARREGATLFMTLLAAWQALLGRWAAADDVVVGTPVAGRTHAELEGLIGFFVNMLPLRARLGGDPTFAELVGRVRETALGAYAHQELPFERMVEELAAERSLTHTPLFQAIFSLARSAAGDLPRLGEVAAEPFGAGDDVAKFDLELAMRDGDEALCGELAYRAALFDAETAERMARHLVLLLEAMGADPSRRLSQVSLLSADERSRVLEEWNATASVSPRGCVHELFAEQAARTPDAPAVVSGGEVLTYAELADRAARLARHLADRGVEPEARVALCLERGADLVAALLAVLRAGGAYLPVDPQAPAARVREILVDAGCALAVTHADWSGAVPDEVRTIRIDDPETASALASLPSDAPSAASDPERLAYVIYTSGSTGRPKGVAVPHRAVVRLVRETGYAAFGPGERVAQLSSPAFDAATFEIWGALLNGGALVVFPAGPPSVEELGAVLRDQGVTTLWLTAGLFHRMVDGNVEGLGGVRQLVAGGDVLSPAHVRRVLEAHPGLRLVNGYGPTENTTFTCCHAVDGVRDGASVPIGRPIAHTRVYVVDSAGAAAPAGVPGELYAGGAGVARGYLGDPARTAERFVPDPFSGEPGARLYRTGDRVRWLADGVVEYLGRMDEQVKLRGFRVEPGEIEAVLRAHPGVRDAAVVARGDDGGEKRLAAYLAASAESGLSAAEVRGYLADRVPDYMVPAAFVVLDALPLTANGKVDRRLLPDPEAWGEEAAYEAPRTAVEEIVAGTWAEVLRRERVGRRDDFFLLGGHSLLATQVVSRLRLSLGVEVPLRALFESPTVAALAERVEALRDAGAAPRVPPLARVSRAGTLPLSFAQQRLWFIQRLDPGSAAYNMPFALRLSGAVDAAALERALTRVVERHEALRTAFPEINGRAMQVIYPPAPVPLPRVDLRALAPEAREREARRLAGAEALRPFDLGRGPLLRALLLTLAADEHVLLFCMHHAVGDGWSMGVLSRELSALYGGYARGEEPALPELPVQYADYAAWQRAWLTDEVLEGQLAYWRARLAGAPPLLELPTDRPRAPEPDPRGGSVRFALPAEAARGLRALARSEGATPFMVLLAAWQLLLSRHAGQDDVVVGTPISGRTAAELEGLVGCFVNTLALRQEVSPAWSFRELLARVRETTLGAYQHQALPFEKLVEELGVERALAHTPVFQAMLVFQNHDRGELALGAAGAASLEGAAAPVKFDLTLAVEEADDGLRGVLSYRRSLWDAETMERLVERYGRVLAEAAARPERRVDEIPLLSPAERARVVAGGAGPRLDLPRETVHQRFAAQAARTPDAVAVACGGETLTFAGLERRAAAVARRLRAAGVGPEARVGIRMERSPGVVAAVLGVLRAGGAYVPLDPAYPEERLLYMLRDSGARVLVVDDTPPEGLAGFGGEVLRVGRDDEGADVSGPGPDLDLDPDLDPENLAYVIYTSGSTGRPKGVGVTHGGLAAYLAYAVEAYGAGEGAGAPVHSSLSFDLTVTSLFAPLLAGRPVTLVPEGEGVEGLGEALRRGGGFSLVKLTPAHLPLLAEQLGARGLAGRARALVVGGEQLAWETLAPWLRHAPETVVFNEYGPTETVVGCCVQRVEAGDAGSGAVPIGAPIPGARLHLLDPRGEPVPPGVRGELYVGGAGVARGYLGRPALTAERFVPDPFGEEPGARLYRTGDRVRRRADGALEFVGRVDDQVKIRGFRVEPGEAEAVLRGHPGVREAAVVAREDAPGETRLVAYVVAEAGAAELRAWLRERLPEHLVPAAFVPLDALPLTPNGKVDRRALPAPERGGGGGADEGPLTPTEAVLADIWGSLLELDGARRVGVRENFFELGGHSLLATQVVARVRQAFGVDLPLRVVFEAPTVAELAARVDASVRDAVEEWEVEEELRRLEGLSDAEVEALLRGGARPGGGEDDR